MANKHLEKRIDNTLTALQFCRDNRSAWGIQYWSNVLGILIRQLRRGTKFDN